MIKVYGRFDYEASDDNIPSVFSFPEDGISYMEHYAKGKGPKDKVTGKPLQALIRFHHSEELDNFNVIEFRD